MIDKETIYSLTIGQGLTDKQASAVLGISPKTYARTRRSYEILYRQRHNSIPREGKGDQLSREILEKLYYQDGLSQGEIAAKLGINRCTVKYAMQERFQMPTRDKKSAWALRKQHMKEKGEHFHTYKGGRWYDQNGYVRIMRPEDYPFRRRKNKQYIFEHILVWEMAHGEEIPEGCSVHHINGIRDDNRAENLCVLSHSEHGKFGATLRKILYQRIQDLEAEVRKLRGEYTIAVKAVDEDGLETLGVHTLIVEG